MVSADLFRSTDPMARLVGTWSTIVYHVGIARKTSYMLFSF